MQSLHHPPDRDARDCATALGLPGPARRLLQAWQTGRYPLPCTLRMPHCVDPLFRAGLLDGRGRLDRRRVRAVARAYRACEAAWPAGGVA